MGAWLGLVVYAAALLRFPTAAYLIAIPLLLPVLDLAPLSGRFFWDEFDLLLAMTLGVRLLMRLPGDMAVPLPKAALWLLFASVVASTAIGVWPLAPIDANAFSSYLSTYNALRIAKGLCLGRRNTLADRRDASAGRMILPLQLGLALGLAAAAVSVYWERLLFHGSPGLDNVFRAAGLVSATHVGWRLPRSDAGDACAIWSCPCGRGQAPASAGHRGISSCCWMGRGSLDALAGSACRLGHLSCGIRRPVVVEAQGRWRGLLHRAATMGHRAGHTRLARSGTTGGAVDIYAPATRHVRVRLCAARCALERGHRPHANGPAARLLGMGLGSFPREFYLAYAGTRQLPGYLLETQAGSGSHYLVLTGGRGMYMDQRIAARGSQELRLRGLIRSPQTGARLSVSLCAKSFLNSVGCDEAVVLASPTWRSFEVRLASPAQAEVRTAPTAPVSLSLHNGTFGSSVEVTGLTLVGRADGAARQWVVRSWPRSLVRDVGCAPRMAGTQHASAGGVRARGAGHPRLVSTVRCHDRSSPEKRRAVGRDRGFCRRAGRVPRGRLFRQPAGFAPPDSARCP